MQLEGLIINFLGDSITEGIGTTGPDKVFHQIIEKKYSLKKAYNYGVGGTRIARNTAPAAQTIWDYNFCLREEIMNRDADAVIVFGGTNDFGHGDAPFGTLSDTDNSTFCGSVNYLINKLRDDYPSSKIIFITPLHRLGEDNPSTPDLKKLSDFAQAIRTICNQQNIPVIDLFEINPLDPEDKELLPDGLHPNDKGHSIIADIIAEELIKIV